MTANKRITDLTDYTSVLPYASELFGVYQPMIGWRSRRQLSRYVGSAADDKEGLLRRLAANYSGDASKVQLSLEGCTAKIGGIGIGRLRGPTLVPDSSSQLLTAIAGTLPARPPKDDEWQKLINAEIVGNLLNTRVAQYYVGEFETKCGQQQRARPNQKASLVATETASIKYESALAGALLDLVNAKSYPQLRRLFYVDPVVDPAKANADILRILGEDDPFATFDPKRDITSVSLSPLGIVHLFRQFFFELDSFLGTPTGHVWLSPGSTVELVEISTRRAYTEKLIEQSLETTQKTEDSSTDKDELSEAVKSDNKTDLKLGASITVNQSWGTGNATATGSMNMDTTQDNARESGYKRMREQSSKLSTEIRQNFKSTFKTINETVQTSSKRYVLNNTTDSLINYELRRKMRQVGVQVQDVGSYLCWETFVDEPGADLGLANLVNIAKPADLEPVPAQSMSQYPPDKSVSFTGPLAWTFDNTRRFAGPDGFLPLGSIALPPAPDGYDLKYPGSVIDLVQVSGTGNDFSGTWTFKGKLVDVANIQAGPAIGPSGLKWDQRVDFVVGGVVAYTPSATKRKAIDDANAANAAAIAAATLDNERKTRQAFVDAAKTRIEAASNVGARKYEDLREEERIVVYRKLIRSLMSDALYNLPESTANDHTRHVMSELLNSIFDIDKMLYFVAPEWWKPRMHRHQYLAQQSNEAIFTESVTNWADGEARPDNYYITEKSGYAKLGSSLGWLLQLDGDDLRNAFLNAPWVKAVIPIRPGKELEATNWLQQMHVEGTDGLQDEYSAPAEELEKISATVGHAPVTIADALSYLCADVKAKYQESLKVGRFPAEEINDDNRVSATPVDKVYEHGFYPLQGGFRAVTSERFEVFAQWIEVLPTDQVVPVEVSYDRRTGRQLP
jgi:hypothetical protein